MSGGPGRGPGRKVRREEHVELTIGAEGVRSVKRTDKGPEPPGAGEYGEPCYGCDCCRKWTETLELLRAHVVSHNERVPALFPCPGECLVCASTTWTGEPT